MQGMLSQAQQPAPAESQPADGQTPTEQPQEQAALDSQEAYDVAAGQMLNFVYDPQGIEALNGMVKAAGDPQAGMARLFGRLLLMTVQSAGMSNKRVSPNVVFQAGIEVIRAMSEVAQAQGILTAENEKDVTEAAFYDGMALFANEAKDEALTRQEREQYVALLDAVEKMEQKAGGSLPQGQPETEQPPQEAQA